MDIESLVNLPEFQERNNFDLPFEPKESLRVGVFGEFLRVAPTDRLEWGARTANLIRRASFLGRGPRPYCLPDSVEFVLTHPEGIAKTELKIEMGEDGARLTMGDTLAQSARTAVEVWEQGTLVRKTCFPGRNHQTLAEIRPGVALSVRFENDLHGLEVLVSEDEFSSEEWKDAVLFLLLDGRLRQAAAVLKEEVFSRTERMPMWSRLEAFLEALSRNTKSIPFGLAPIPLMRGAALEAPADPTERFPVVWEGIKTCWPGAVEETGAGIPDLNTEIPSGVDELVAACRSKKTCDVIDLRSSFDEARKNHDAILANGWAALLGWSLVDQKKFEEAGHAFTSVEPAEGDPFSLRAGTALTNHLVVMSQSNGLELDFETNDAVWSRILPNPIR